jgi:hypothetical protein
MARTAEELTRSRAASPAWEDAGRRIQGSGSRVNASAAAAGIVPMQLQDRCWSESHESFEQNMQMTPVMEMLLP